MKMAESEKLLVEAQYEARQRLDYYMIALIGAVLYYVTEHLSRHPIRTWVDVIMFVSWILVTAAFGASLYRLHCTVGFITANLQMVQANSEMAIAVDELGRVLKEVLERSPHRGSEQSVIETRATVEELRSVVRTKDSERNRYFQECLRLKADAAWSKDTRDLTLICGVVGFGIGWVVIPSICGL